MTTSLKSFIRRNRHGIYFQRRGKNNKNHTRAVYILYKLYKDSPSLFSQMMKVFSQAFRIKGTKNTIDHAALTSEFLDGFSTFIVQYHKNSLATVGRNLADFSKTACEICQIAKERSSSSSNRKQEICKQLQYFAE